MKKILIVSFIFSFLLCFALQVNAEPVADNITADQVLADDAAMNQVQPLDLQIYQEGDSIFIIAYGETSAFYVPADSNAGKAFSIIGVIIAIMLSIIAIIRQFNFKHRLSDSK